MKKTLWGVLVILGVVLGVKIAKILIFDISRLTEYGIGYLVGLLVLFSIILILTIFIGFKIFRKNHLP